MAEERHARILESAVKKAVSAPPPSGLMRAVIQFDRRDDAH